MLYWKLQKGYIKASVLRICPLQLFLYYTLSIRVRNYFPIAESGFIFSVGNYSTRSEEKYLNGD